MQEIIYGQYYSKRNKLGCQNLKNLDISNTHVTNESINCINVHAGTLEILNAEQNNKIEGNVRIVSKVKEFSLKNLISMKTLKELKLGGCSKIWKVHIVAKGTTF